MMRCMGWVLFVHDRNREKKKSEKAVIVVDHVSKRRRRLFGLIRGPVVGENESRQKN